MSLLQLLPASARRRIRRVRQDLRDVRTALLVPRRPLAREGSLTDPGVYQGARRTAPSPVAAEPRPHSADTAASVYFADHDRRVAMRAGQTILEAGLEAGLDLDFSCTMGGCAACALQIIEGQVVYDGPNCLTDAERQDGMCLACVGRPLGELVVGSLD